MNSQHIFGYPVREVTRDFFFNIGDRYGIVQWIVFAASIAAVVLLIRSIITHGKSWGLGKTDNLPRPVWQRFKTLFTDFVLHKRMMRDPLMGISHMLVMKGIFGIVFLLLVAAIHSLFPYGNGFLFGIWYMIYAGLSDFFHIVIILGLGILLYHRYVLSPASLDTTRKDIAAFWVIVALVATGLLHNAVRVAITNWPDFETAAPLTFAFSKLFVWGNEQTLAPVHTVLWWAHAVLLFYAVSFAMKNSLGFIPLSCINIYSTDIRNALPSTKYITEIPLANSESQGKESLCIADFSWKDLMDLDSCTSCGLCEENCPAHLAQLPLSPKKLIANISHCYAEAKKNPADDHRPVAGSDDLKDSDVWSCTMCASCVEKCPSRIDHLSKINLLKSHFQKVTTVPKMFASARKAIAEKGNPYGHDSAPRGDWFSGIDNVAPLSQKADVDYIFFAGCAAAFDPSAKKSARAFLTILSRAGLKIGLLGAEELCCGESSLRMGNTETFRELAKSNLDLFRKYMVKKIIIMCPHGYNTLNKEYRAVAKESSLPDSYEVFSHVAILSQLLEQGKIIPNELPRRTVTYHDPCFLGRYNEMYDLPRALIDAVPGTVRIDMPRSKKNSLCCGGDLRFDKASSLKVSSFRARDLQASGASIVITACPHCVHQLQKGFKEIGATAVSVMDLSEYLTISCGLEIT